jgi:hypothetical protein
LNRAASFLALLSAIVATGCRDIVRASDFRVGNRIENPCGALQVLADGTCRNVGVGACATNFVPDGRGGCDPILPSSPCQVGYEAQLGGRACSYLGYLSCPLDVFATIDTRDPVVYVDGNAPLGGDGTIRKPFHSIADALDSTSGDLAVLLAAGVFKTNVTLANRRVRLVGLCSEKTAIEGQDPSKAAISIEKGADGSHIEGLSVIGNNLGIEVTGAADVQIVSTWVHDVGGHGITFTDTGGPSSGLISRSLIERSLDAGVSVFGAGVTVDATQITHVSPLHDGDRAIGILAGASPVFMGDDPTVRNPATLTVQQSVIDHSRGAGILLDVANATIVASVISEVAPDARGRGSAIEDRAHPAPRIPTSLVLRQSVIEQAHDVGVRLWNADATIEDSVVRDVGADQTGRCLGNGIRARYDLLRDLDLGVRLTVHRSIIEATHQAGIHMEGGSAVVDDSIIRGTLAEPCRNDFGDGVATYPSPVSSPKLSLVHTRIENSARAAVASRGDALTVTGSTFECNALGVLASASGASAESTTCGCKGVWRTCGVGQGDVASSLFGGAGCASGDATACLRLRAGSVTTQEGGIPNATVWVFDHDEIASAMTDATGYAELEGIPREAPSVVSIVAEGFAQGMANAAPLAADSPGPVFATLVPFNQLQLSMILFFGPRDLRDGPLLLVRICRSPLNLVGNLCDGLPGVTAELSPGPSRGPTYSNDNALPDPSVTATVTPDIFFENVAPGEHFVTLHGPPGKALHCAPEPGGFGWPTAQPNVFRVYVEETYTVFGAALTCSLTDL